MPKTKTKQVTEVALVIQIPRALAMHAMPVFLKILEKKADIKVLDWWNHEAKTVIDK